MQTSPPTRFDNIHPNILHHRINLLPQEARWHKMDVVDALSILGCKGRRGRHCIAAMSCEDLLVGFETAVGGTEMRV